MKTKTPWLRILLLLAVVGVGCTHKHDGELIKTANGSVYKLDADACREGYRLIQIDTLEYNLLLKPFSK